ncbi:hypothetical protein ABEB36_006206 [Hypothenemus hampei]|uniref:Uncharacterized protein n=1 Tax=Hypothenemus hampei TaxID=57062 RepID=A0ABD1EPS1_HYPHA
MDRKKFSKLFKDNLVLLTGITLIIAIHWGWYKIQQNPTLVDPKDNKGLFNPMFKTYKEAIFKENKTTGTSVKE